jgi:hypothetical protein
MESVHTLVYSSLGFSLHNAIAAIFMAIYITTAERWLQSVNSVHF